MKENVSVRAAASKAPKLRSLREVNRLVREKHAADLFRFRTCCCDVRASK